MHLIHLDCKFYIINNNNNAFQVGMPIMIRIFRSLRYGLFLRSHLDWVLGITLQIFKYMNEILETFPICNSYYRKGK